MAKFNESSNGINVTTNYEGAKAYKLSSEMELYTAVVTSTLEPKFYESSDDRIERIRKLILKNPEFAMKLAIYARENMHLRSIPLVLMVELLKIDTKELPLSKVITRVIQRADEITEILAYYKISNERTDLKPLASQLKKGVANAFEKFDEYQFAKYNRDGMVRLRDALFLTHPKPKRGRKRLYKKIAEDKLEVPYTWEVELSKIGQEYEDVESKLEAKRAKWVELINSGRLGYMALLRNLRNILEVGVSGEVIDSLGEKLSDEEAVKYSKQLPFRFFSAYKVLKEVDSFQVSSILDALEKAVLASVDNIKGFDSDTNVVIACDVSGSMESSISEKSVVQLYDIGLLLGCLLQNKCKSVINGFFGERWKVVNLPKNNVLQSTMELHAREGEVGYSTNGYKVIEYLLENNLKADKIFMFTDCQLWDSYYNDSNAMLTFWKGYKEKFPLAKMYLFDLAGYGNTPLNINEKDVYLISGWSSDIFNVLDGVENGGSALNRIREIEI